MKKNHELNLIQRWESFESKISDYNGQCFNRKKAIEKEIIEKTELPVWSGYSDTPGINSFQLALFVWQRQTSHSFYALRINDRSQLFLETQCIGRGTEQQLLDLQAVIEKLIFEKETSAKVKQSIQDIHAKEEAEELYKKLIDYSQSYHLKGKCSYLKS